MGIKNEKVKVEALWEVTFKSSLAEHRDVYFCNINVWRDGNLLPEPFKSLVHEGAEGDSSETEVSGRDFFHYDPLKIYEIKPHQFRPPQKMVNPKLYLGRFYPLGYFRELPGIYEGNPYPGRIIKIDPTRESYTLDTNHPLAVIEKLHFKMHLLRIVPKISEVGGRCKDFCELAFRTGPGMQARYDDIPTDFGLAEKESFSRMDENPDKDFYKEPRFLPHIDRLCHKHLIEFYEKHLKGKKILDFMSSFESHLPEGDYEVVGLGINEEELKANPRLKEFVVKDINEDPSLPFANEEFDAVVCDLSIEYIIHPLEILKELHRILKPGGKVFFSFSNRYFPPKVIKLWVDLHEFERMGYVCELFAKVGGFKNIQTYSLRGFPRPIDDRWYGVVFQSDPLYVVWAEKEV
ncbi:MAG: methyltransferase domain-containing protein [Caldimicrobium sp.]